MRGAQEAEEERRVDFRKAQSSTRSLKIDGLSEAQCKQLSTQLGAWIESEAKEREIAVKKEADERRRAIDSRTSMVTERLPRSSDIPVGSTFVKQAGATIFYYTKSKDGKLQRLPFKVPTMGSTPGDYDETPYRLPILTAAPGAGDGVPGRYAEVETGGNFYLYIKCSDNTWRRVQIT